jgi:hypothetical protein
VAEMIRVTARARSGALLVEGQFFSIYRGLRKDRIEIIAQAEDGRRLTVSIPCAELEDVPSAEPPPDLAEHARAAEDAVVAAVLARSQMGLTL